MKSSTKKASPARPTGKSASLGRKRAPREKDPFLVAVGARIRTARMKMGHNQERLAPLVPVERAYMGGLERGERNMSLSMLARLAIALEVEIADLVPTRAELRKLMKPIPVDEPPAPKRKR